MVSILECIYGDLDRSKAVSLVFLDLCKAFDVVDHSVLLKKLQILGIQGTSLKTFELYLSLRQQYTVCNGNASDGKVIRCGVPQGSVVGPLLFVIYVNDLINCDINGNIVLYADDTVLFYSGDMESMFCEAQNDLNKINNCHNENR